VAAPANIMAPTRSASVRFLICHRS
jgi:hypothetical protein